MKQVFKSQKIDIKKPHLRWNYEKSPDRDDALRYHFVIVGDRIKRDNLCDILSSNLNSNGEPLEIIRELPVQIKNSRYNAKFVSYDTRASPNLLNLHLLNINSIIDNNLVERIKKGSSIENYVTNIYS